ncbi:armadillo-type protein [Pholiota molesta]|nr:armadillo-type protein [Pholiota molesta]
MQNYFKEAMNSENVVPNLFERLSDSSGSVRFAAAQAISMLSMHDTYRKAIQSSISISNFIKHLEDDSWSTRQRAIRNLEQFAINVDFQAAMNTEKTVSLLAKMLVDDCDEDVRAAAATALSVFGAQELFQKTVKSEEVIEKLTTRLSDPYASVRDAAQTTLLALSEKGRY